MLIIPDYDAQALAAPQSFRDGIQAAIDILDNTFVTNITVKIAIGFGEAGVFGALPNQNTSLGGFTRSTSISYSDLRSDLIKMSDVAAASSSLPNTGSVNGHSSFTISSAQEKLFGLLGPNDTGSDDGQIGMGTGFTGNVLISGALHELTHALGRTNGSSLDVFRFTSQGNRLFTGGATAVPAYFSIDNGATALADYGQTSDPGDFLNPPGSARTPNDPFNESVGNLGALTAVDITQMEVLGFSVDKTAPLEPASTLPVSVGGTATISHDFLWSTDNLSSPNNLTYRMLTAPTHGTVLVSGVVASSFTEADIQAGRVQYRNSGDGAASDSFNFKVTDFVGNSTPDETFQIAILDTAAPRVANNNGLVASIGATSTLLGWSLDTVALGNTPGQLNYTVLTAPSHGTLLVNGVAASSFTQADIDSYRVRYRENGDTVPSDSFTFQVADAAGDHTAAATFNIAILAAPPPQGYFNILVTSFYDHVLDRAPDLGGFAHWVAALASGASAQDVQLTFAHSAEAQNDVTQLYNQILGRAPDAGGFTHWIDALANGEPLKGVRIDFAHSAEAQNDLTQFFSQILGRAPDSGTFLHWVDALASGMSLQAVRGNFAHSAEAQGDLTSLFQSVAGRAPDMAELAGLTNKLAPFGASLSSVTADLASHGPSGFTLVTPSSGVASLTASTAPEAFDFTGVAFTAETISGFDPSQDAIRWHTGASGGALGSGAGALPTLSAVTGGTLVAFDASHSLTLAGVAPTSLSAANFRLV